MSDPASANPDQAGPTPAGPTTLATRALAPDLARGFMLLFIALANAHVYLFAREFTLRGYPAEGTLPDQLVALVQMTLVDGRAYPMFSVLFGYGLVQLLRRQTGRGGTWESVHTLVRRRGAWMLVFGAAHAILLFPGDIIASYGLAALIFVGMLRAGDATLLWVSGAFLGLAALVGLTYGMDEAEESFQLPSMARDNPLLALADRALEWASFLFWGQMLLLVPAVLLGIWAGRRRVLDEPERHRGLLRRAAVLGLGLAVLGALPLASMSALFWTEPSTDVGVLAGGLHTVTGYAGGLGWAALVGLIAIRLDARRGPVTTAIDAVGQRSMSCYLMQSVVFIAVFAPYAGGLGATLGIAGTSAIAVATWLLTVLAADVMRRTGHRGPAEIALRRLTYRGGYRGAGPR